MSGASPKLSPREILSGCPIVRIEQAWIARRIHQQPASAFEWACLQERLLWLRQTMAQTLILRSTSEPGEPKVEREGKPHIDTEGLFESIFGPRNALTEALGFAQDRSIIGDPSLEVVVLFGVQDRPVLMSDGPQAVRWNMSNERKKRYRSIPQGWFYADTEILTRLLDLAAGVSPSAAPLHVDGPGLQKEPLAAPTLAAANTPLTKDMIEARMRPIGLREAFPTSVIWRSSNTNETNQRIANSVRERIAKATSAMALPLPATAK
jgi:hypothetical protein